MRLISEHLHRQRKEIDSIVRYAAEEVAASDSERNGGRGPDFMAVRNRPASTRRKTAFHAPPYTKGFANKHGFGKEDQWALCSRGTEGLALGIPHQFSSHPPCHRAASRCRHPDPRDQVNPPSLAKCAYHVAVIQHWFPTSQEQAVFKRARIKGYDDGLLAGWTPKARRGGFRSRFRIFGTTKTEGGFIWAPGGGRSPVSQNLSGDASPRQARCVDKGPGGFR